MPKKGSVPQVTMGEARSSMFDAYMQVNSKLSASFDALQAQDAKVEEKVESSDISAETARGYITTLINDLNTAASTPPADEINEDQHVMQYIAAGMDASVTIMTEALDEQEEHGDDIDEQTAMTEELLERIKALEEAVANPAGTPLPLEPGDYDLNDPGLSDPFAPGEIDMGDLGLDDIGTDGSLTPDDSGLGSQTPGPSDGLGNVPGTTTPTTPAMQPAASPMGSGMDMLGPLMQMMQQQAMMRNMADQDLNNRRRELDPDRFEDEIAAVAPPPVTAPVTAQPAAVQQSTTAPATHHGQPTGTTSSTQPTGAPTRTPGADGSVVYTFPDGRTQKVSVLVAQALDAAFGNKSGTDAQKAYEKTSAKWSEQKQIGDRVDPHQLMTGDVATWDKGTALVVVFGSQEGGAPESGTLEVVVNGELKPFSMLMTGDGGKGSEMSDFAEKFGQFTGFAHPKGIELTAPADGAAPPAMTGSADQSANAAMPVVAAG
ncbi:hypothetical protein AB0M45_31985 [Nocardia sp. NPDC051787]|uniref:hypothetical protein n=1 Tax=Nocardia sp. NPDC051787 TaxID=3155415 RepID=UPI003437E832